MQLELRSSLFGACAILIATASGMRIGMYTPIAMAGLFAALALGLGAVSLRKDRPLELPRVVGRIGLAVGVLLTTAIGRATLAPAWNLPLVVHVLISLGIVVLLIRSRGTLITDAHPALALAALVLPCVTACRDGLAYPDPDSFFSALLPWLSLTLFGIVGVAVTRCTEQLNSRTGLLLLGAMLALGGSIRAIGVIASPDPIIDVWAWRKESPRYLLNGTNPYGADYSDVYASERAKSYDLFDPASSGSTRELPTYPPLPIYLSVPFAALGLDVRYADVCCDVLASLMLYLAGWMLGNRVVGIIAAAVYLGMPLSARVIEQSWYEPMLAALFGAGLVLLKRGYRIGGLLLGLGLVGKQFGLILAPSTTRACRRHWRALAVGLGLAVLLTLGVFLIWDADWFLRIILFNHLGLKPRPDSLTLASFFLTEFDYQVSSKVLWAAMLLLCGYIAFRTPPCPIVGAAWVGMSLLVFCLFNIQANYNYFYLCVYFLLLGMVGLSATASDQEFARCRIESPVKR